jgi:hypothetical protein
LKKVTAMLSAVFLAAVLAGVAMAHSFTASTAVTSSAVPLGPVVPGTRVVVFGEVNSSRSLCVADRLVRLKRVRTPGPDPILAKTYTNRQGRYFFLRTVYRTQALYVSVRRLVRTPAGHSHVCAGSRSVNVRVNVR